MAYKDNISYFDPKEGSRQQQVFNKPATSIYRVEDAQANWGEQDPSKPGYIKNKPIVQQEKGDSEVDLMSQRAISKEFDQVGEEIFNIEKQNTQQDTNIESLQKGQIDSMLTIEDLQKENKKLQKRLEILEEASLNNLYIFEEDNSIAYEKCVPMNSMTHASLNYVGGISITEWPEIKENRVSFKGLNGVTDSGLTFSYDETTKIITINGTCEQDYTNFLPMENYSVNNGKVYGLLTVIGGSIDSEGAQLCFVDAAAHVLRADLKEYGQSVFDGNTFYSGVIDAIVIANASGVTFTNYQIKVELGDERKDYIQNCAVSAIELKGKNLFPEEVKDAKNWTKRSPSSDWYDYYLNLPDGWFCISVKLLSNHNKNIYYYLQQSTDGGKSYTSANSGYNDKGLLGAGYLVTGNGLERNPLWFKVDNKEGIIYRLTCNGLTQTKIDFVYDQQIEFADLKQTPSSSYLPSKQAPTTEYELPKESILYQIPEEIKNLEGYGLGISENLFNYIDFENQLFVKKVASRKYQNGDSNNETMVTNGKITIYPLEQDEIIDISSILNHDGILRVKEKEWLIFENENKNKIPSQISYQIKL